MRDRIALWVSYVLLVGIVVFLAFDVDRKLDNSSDLQCSVAVVQFEAASIVVRAQPGNAGEIELTAVAIELDDLCDVFTDDERELLESTFD